MKTQLVRRERLSESEVEEMHELHAAYFRNGDPAVFRDDLAAKDWVVLLRAAGGIAGFSTVQLLDDAETGARVLFSGDTIVDRSKRTTCALAGAFGHAMRRFRPVDRDFYWLLICKGHRTYRFLPCFFHEFFPRPGAAGCALGQLRDRIAAERFGPSYDPVCGVISFQGTRDCLRPACAEVPAVHARDPYVQYFLQCNPAYRQGDELACLAPLSEENLNRLGRRVIERTAVEWVE